MILYDLQCRACGHTYEDFQPMDALRPVKCPKCGKKKVVRMLARPAIHTNYSPMHPRKNRGRGY